MQNPLIQIGQLQTSNGSVRVTKPALLSLASMRGGLCILANGQNRSVALTCLQSLPFDMLSHGFSPCRFLLYDGTGGGKNLKELTRIPKNMLVTGSMLTTPDQLSAALRTVAADRSDLYQNVLGHRFDSLARYNATPGTQPRPYTVIVMADFPHGIQREDGELLEQLMRDAGQSGILLLLHVDGNYKPESTLVHYDPISLLQLPARERPVVLIQPAEHRPWLIRNHQAEQLFNRSFRLAITAQLPTGQQLQKAVDQYVRKQALAQKPMSLASTLYTQQRMWTRKATKPVTIPIAADADVNLRLHGLVAGVTGSGKSVLLHDIIMGGAWLYSPEELQFVLLDYKEGVEFSRYAPLPHVRVLGMEAERSYGKSVLHYIKGEFERRAKTIRNPKVGNPADIYAYNQRVDAYNQQHKAPGARLAHIPVLLVIIDEFQVLLGRPSIDNDHEEIRALLEDITKQGRSMGVHLLLSTQTLASGVHIDLSNVNNRIALKLTSREDCETVLAPGNLAPLSIGNFCAVLNDDFGSAASNVVVQPAYLDEKNRGEISQRVNVLSQAYARRQSKQQPMEHYIYNGKQPVAFEANSHRRKGVATAAGCTTIWLGEPATLSAQHTCCTLRPEAASNILLIGNDQLSAMSVIYYTVRQFLSQHGQQARCVLLDQSGPTHPACAVLGQLARLKQVNYARQYADMKKLLSEYIKHTLTARRQSGTRAPAVLVVMANMGNARLLAKNIDGDVPEEVATLVELLHDGPELGLHTLLHTQQMRQFSDMGSYGQQPKLDYFNIQIGVQGADTEELFSDYQQKQEAKAMPTARGAALLRIADQQVSQRFSVYALPHTN